MSTKVVLIHTETPTQRSMIRSLQERNFNTREFKKGQEALHYLKNPRADIDLMISKRRLPGKISGEALVRVFQEMRRDVPILVISKEEWHNAGIPVINEPFAIPEFLEKVEQLLEAYR